MKKLINFITVLFIFSGCSSRATSLEDVTEEVISKKQGVVIDIEPSQKK